MKVQRGMVHQDFKKTDTSDEAGKGWEENFKGREKANKGES